MTPPLPQPSQANPTSLPVFTQSILYPEPRITMWNMNWIMLQHPCPKLSNVSSSQNKILSSCLAHEGFMRSGLQLPHNPSPLSSSIGPVTWSSSEAPSMLPATGLWTCSSHFLDCFFLDVQRVLSFLVLSPVTPNKSSLIPFKNSQHAPTYLHLLIIFCISLIKLTIS